MGLIIGSHVSYKSDMQLVGCVNEALCYGANTFMFYTGAPQNTKRSNIDLNLVLEAKRLMKENNIDINNVVVHAPYIINLANDDNLFGISFLKQEIERCKALGINKIILHPGSSVNVTREKGVENISMALNEVLKNETDIIICLETMAGKGNEVGSNILELKEIISNIENKNLVGICLDTCHLNDSGYDITDFDNILDEIDKLIGIDKIKCIHINDSRNIRGSKKDRHENIGFGNISFSDMLNIIYNKRLESVPKILETPYVTKTDIHKERLYPPYKQEIEMIVKKDFDKELINKIRKYYN